MCWDIIFLLKVGRLTVIRIKIIVDVRLLKSGSYAEIISQGIICVSDVERIISRYRN